jgi:hypothetical protein
LIFQRLKNVLKPMPSSLERFRSRNILDFIPADEPEIGHLFHALLSALSIAEGSRRGARSPVAVAKALHLLAPGFFPLWDEKIAQAYSFDYFHDQETNIYRS